MKQLCLTPVLLLVISLFATQTVQAQSPKELPLWPDGIPDNPVVYVQELVRSVKAQPSSPSQMNRVFSQVSEPTYQLFGPGKEKANGVALVICPGGGFKDVWYDREGVDFAMWLADRGISSLVLKYRTFNSDSEGFRIQETAYQTEVYADARQAIHILRSQAKELGIDKDKIGIAGYSAGGTLSLMAALELHEKELPDYVAFQTLTRPDFACLIYPWIRKPILESLAKMEHIPPMFMINGAEDVVTPASVCMKFYSTLLVKKVPAELHVYSKGRHGFDSGIGHGHGIGSWQESFILWLKDMKILQ